MESAVLFCPDRLGEQISPFGVPQKKGNSLVLQPWAGSSPSLGLGFLDGKVFYHIKRSATGVSQYKAAASPVP